MRRVGMALIVALSAAACGSGSSDVAESAPDSEAAGPTSSDTSDAGTSAPANDATWCETWRHATSLIEGADPESAVLEQALSALRRDAPSELRDAVEEMTSSYEAALAEDQAPTLSAASHAALVDWGHEHCGDPAPLCSLWPSYTTLIAFSALDPEAADWTTAIEEYGAVTLARFPPELDEPREAIQAFGSSYSDELEPAAEAAFDEVDAWVDLNCG